VLTDPTGSALAQCKTADQHYWRHQAEQLGHVVVIYGARIGVRRPGGTAPDRYNDQTRAAKLSRSRGDGMVNWGIVQLTAK
jgi:hypothetical protein